jgi:hypothetical protein
MGSTQPEIPTTTTQAEYSMEDLGKMQQEDPLISRLLHYWNRGTKPLKGEVMTEGPLVTRRLLAQWERIQEDNGFGVPRSCSVPFRKIQIAPELTVATTAVRMNYLIVKELDYTVDDTYFWTDSTGVLCYTRNETSRYKTFVANTVASIHDRSTKEQRNCVPTKVNPAADASHGLPVMPVDQFLKNQRWTVGHQF